MSEPLRYPRPRDLARLGRRHNVIESSAGTGKTFLLEHMFVDWIVERGVPIEEILVVTFTEKATAELMLRLRKLLAELEGLGPDHPKVKQAASASPGESWIIDARAKQRLTSALLSFHRANISTIHGFCQRILRENAFVQGRLFDEKLVAEKVVIQRALRELLRLQAGLAGPSALRAWLAGGKTVAALETLLCECAGHATKEIHPPFDAGKLDQAMRAWPRATADESELLHRLKQEKVHAGTAKACASELVWLAQAVASHRDDPLGLLSEKSARRGLLGTLAYLEDRLPKNAANAAIAELARAVSLLQAAAVPLEAAAASVLLPLLRERAAADKRRAGTFDYADMLGLVGQALADGSPIRESLLLSLRRRYRVALIDEFQDTDHVQWSIFQHIFVDGTDGHALNVIGDPKQAIYGFRGADVHAYLQARKDLGAAAAGSVSLSSNYRSTADLVSVQNLLFSDQAGFFRADSGIRYDSPVSCGRLDRVLEAPAAELATPVVVLSLESGKPSVRAPELRAVLGASIVQELRRLLDPSCSLRLHGRSDGRAWIRPSDIFVLTFSNRESQAVGRALGRAGIPYAFYKQGSLFGSPEAEEILAVLRALTKPHDRSLCARAFLTRFFALDLDQAGACLDAQVQSAPCLQLRDWAALAETGDIPGLFASLVDGSAVLRRELFANAGERALTNTLHVLEILQAERAKSHASLPELVELLAGYVRGDAAPPGQDSDLQRLETEKEAVQILTVHMAKGLEADVVFLYGGTGERRDQKVRIFHQSGMPVMYVGKLDDAAQSAHAIDEGDERARLLYVALTRARYRLYLPHYPASFRSLSGPYERANQRLEDVLGPDLAKPHPLFAVRSVGCEASAPASRSASTLASTPIVPAELLTPPSEPADLSAIRNQRSGFLVTSYSAVKRAHSQLARDREENSATDLGGPRRSQGTDELPGGAQTGIFLHELLATVSLADLARRPSWGDWYASPHLQALLARLARRNGRSPTEIEPAARLVHRAYTQGVRLADAVVPGLAAARPSLREMEFHFPIPAGTHPLWSHAPNHGGVPSWKIDRGVVKGFVDFLFEHGGRVYLCDWKSDTLPDYAAAALGRHCQESYEIQARIYTVAVLRLCGIASAADYDRLFGGAFFCFLRGLDPERDGTGIHYLRPDWDAVLGWEKDMLDPRFWGTAP